MEPHAETPLRKSADDRAVLEHPLPPAILGFHAQQACERLLKALLTERGCEYPRTRTHDFGVLEQLIERHDGFLPALAVSLPLLTVYAVPYRYDALELRRTVDDLCAHVEERLKALLIARNQKPVRDVGSESERQDQHRSH